MARSTRLTAQPDPPRKDRAATAWQADRDDDEAEIRFSLTALGEAFVDRERRSPRFRGFGPCLPIASSSLP